jgi:hypothetical protein
MKPNLFDISTKELTQDAFIVWLLEWANKENADNAALHKCGIEFAASLIKKDIPDFSESVQSVKTQRQWNHVDILAVVNEKYCVVIEDKIDTNQHSNQLSEYKKTVEKTLPDMKHIFIFFKTGNDSLTALENIEKKEGYKSYTRQDFLKILEKHDVKNDIYADFLVHLQRIEKETNSFTNKKGLSTWLGSQGFCLYLQKHIKGAIWGYIPNASGGFMSFAYCWQPYKKDGQELNIQIENSFDRDFKVVIKIGGDKWEKSQNILYSTLDVLNKTGKQYDVSFSKPQRYKVGSTSTVAVVNNPIVYDAKENIELEKFLKLLSNLEKIITEITK